MCAAGPGAEVILAVELETGATGSRPLNARVNAACVAGVGAGVEEPAPPLAPEPRPDDVGARPKPDPTELRPEAGEPPPAPAPESGEAGMPPGFSGAVGPTDGDVRPSMRPASLRASDFPLIRPLSEALSALAGSCSDVFPSRSPASPRSSFFALPSLSSLASESFVPPVSPCSFPIGFTALRPASRPIPCCGAAGAVGEGAVPTEGSNVGAKVVSGGGGMAAAAAFTRARFSEWTSAITFLIA
ncbi:Uncharacterised protein [Mycobacteroides abscessus subsp. abscessus]|nr:Uncharacterised protein [Mycobacteroides abscessus subsp. abscessus]